MVCRCIGGRCYVHAAKDINKEELRSDVFDGPCHSVFGDREMLGKPYREVVVYDRDQVFPEWLLIYERCYKRGGPTVPDPAVQKEIEAAGGINEQFIAIEVEE